jgi:hypothetical protein
MWQLKAKIEGKDAKIEGKDANNMSEEQVKKWLEDENINQAIRDCVLLGGGCNGLMLNQFWQMNKTLSQGFNQVFMAFLIKQLDKAYDANFAREKIKDFANALEKLFN